MDPLSPDLELTSSSSTPATDQDSEIGIVPPAIECDANDADETSSTGQQTQPLSPRVVHSDPGESVNGDFHHAIKPNLFHKMISNHPFRVSIVSFGILLVLTILGLSIRGFVIDSTGVFESRNDVIIAREDALYEVQQYENPEANTDFFLLIFYYSAAREVESDIESKDSGVDIFTEPFFSDIKKLETDLQDTKDYSEFTKYVAGQPTLYSPTALLYSGDTFMTGSNYSSAIQTMRTNPQYQFFVTTKMIQDDTSRDITRESWTYSLRNKDFPNRSKRYNHFKNYAGDQILPLLLSFNEKTDKKLQNNENPDNFLKIAFFGSGVTDLLITQIVQNDFSFAFGSMFVVFSIIAAQTQSIFISGFGVFQILLAYSSSYTIYTIFLGYTIFPAICNLAVFVLLGIGADDVFILSDAWKQSHQEPRETVNKDLASKIAYVHNRAFSAMFITTATTVAAFATTAFTPTLPAGIQSFGLFSTICITINFIAVVTFLPAAMVIYFQRFEFLNLGYCIPKTKNFIGHLFPGKEHPLPISPPLSVIHLLNPSWFTFSDNQIEKAPPGIIAVLKQGDDGDVSHLRRLERYFFHPHFYFLRTHTKKLLLFFMIFYAVSIYGATTLAPPERNGSGLPPKDPFTIARNFDANDFAPPPDQPGFGTTISFVFGIDAEDPIDRTGVDPNEQIELGTINFVDMEFTAPVQNALRQFFNETPNEELFVANQITWFESFYQYQINETKWPSSPSNFSADLYFWLSNQSVKYLPNVLFNEDKSKILAFYVDLAADIDPKIPSIKRYSFWETSQKIMDNGNRDLFEPVGMPDGYQSSGSWVNMATSRILFNAAILGPSLSLGFAFIVLTLTSGNFIVAFIATFCIGGVVFFLMWFIMFVGWGLSSLEAIVLMIVVGLAIDFSTHISHSYSDCPYDGRELRVRYSLTSMGVSVSSGAISTSLSTLILGMAALPFFNRFGLMISISMFLSLVYAVVVLPCILLLCGPEGTTGNLKNIFKKSDSA